MKLKKIKKKIKQITTSKVFLILLTIFITPAFFGAAYCLIILRNEVWTDSIVLFSASYWYFLIMRCWRDGKWSL